ncbi:MAG: MBL fold metallo-hydrolase [Spirochaeta sp.]|nr:MBL fold metallo-hydrolase [Spirochaeta sp.]
MRLFPHFSFLDFSNSYLIGPDNGGEAVLIDPGIFDAGLLRLIEDNNYYVRYVLVTHAHASHTRGLKTLLKIYNAKVFAFTTFIQDFAAVKVREGKRQPVGEYHFEIIETPGHSDDSLCFKLDQFLFTGDTLTAGSLSKNPGYAKATLISTIKKKLLTLDDDTLIFPGHGPPSKIAIEREFNPFLQEKRIEP